LQKDLRKCGKTIEELDVKLQKMQGKLAALNDEIAAGDSHRPGIFEEVANVQAEIETTEAEWLDTTERKENIEKQLEQQQKT
jgi:chromosome segregation ATPase